MKPKKLNSGVPRDSHQTSLLCAASPTQHALSPMPLQCSRTDDSEMCFYGPDSPLTQSPRTASLASLLACLMSPNCASAPPATFPIFVFEVAQTENLGAPAEDWLTVHDYGGLSQGS